MILVKIETLVGVFKNSVILAAFWVIALLMFFIGLRGVVDIFQGPAAALTITACTPESYGTAPDRIEGTPRFEPGLGQLECDAPFAIDEYRNNSVFVNEEVEVVGQVCLEAEEPVPYTLSVTWQSTTTPDSFEIIRLPTVFLPGCNEPYDVFYTLPPEMQQLLERDALDGTVNANRWKIVGVAIPDNTEKYEIYKWDSTKEFFVDYTP